MRIIVALFLVFCLTGTARAADPVFRLYAGANGSWFDDNAKPSDFEAGGNLVASFSPHISGVGAAYYGFGHSYLRGSIGFRVTATDVNDPNFSVGLGLQYHASSNPSIRPEGFSPDASIGYRPYPDNWPNVVLVATGSYLMDSNRAFVTAGVRYDLGVSR
jgi:hypothetical protein